MFEPVLRDIRESARRVSIHPLGGGQPIPHPARVSLVHPPFGVLAASISFRSIYTPIGKASVLGARRLQGPPCNIGIGTVPVCSRRWQSALNAGPRSVWRASSLTRGVPASADPCAAWLSRMGVGFRESPVACTPPHSKGTDMACLCEPAPPVARFWEGENGHLPFPGVLAREIDSHG